MSNILGTIFGFGNRLKSRLRDAVSNPSDYSEMTADRNRDEWKRNPEERAMGFFNPVPLGSMGNFVLRKELEDAVTNLSRRDFLKKSAGIAGGSAAASIPGSKLLQKFAPEERAIVKEAVTEAAPKYKYNSLKEYLDDVTKSVDNELMSTGKLEEIDAFGGRGMLLSNRLLKDEQSYLAGKEASKRLPFARIDDIPRGHQQDLENWSRMKNEFSPQAKEEMKALKEMRGRSWENIDEYTREEISRGLFPNHNGSLIKNPANDTYHHYIPGQEGRLSNGFSSLDEASDALTKVLQETWRNKSRTGF